MNRNSKIILAKNIRLDKGYKNILSYNEDAMLSLVESNKVSEASNYSFIKIGDNRISVGIPYNVCLQANYMAIQNPHYSNKWFFAFIDSIEYSSEKSTIINYTVDELSTWHDYYTPSNCFVVREHVNDDTFGLHTVPENLEYGDYIYNEEITTTFGDRENSLICFAISDDSIISKQGQPVKRSYGGIFSGLWYILMKNNESAVNFIKKVDSLAKADAIVAVFMVPSDIGGLQISWGSEGSVEEDNLIEFGWLWNSTNPVSFDNVDLSMNNNLDGYVPKNNKVFTHPYNALMVSNNNGQNHIYKYEDFSNKNDITFGIDGSTTPGCSIKCYPLNYKNIAKNFEFSIACGKFPICSWVTDVYTNWITQNGVNVGLGIASQVVGLGASILTGNVLGGIGTGIGIAQSLGQVKAQSMIPDQARGNTNSGDINYTLDRNNFSFYKVSIKREYAKIIDDYFSRQGYKVNTIKTPNFTGRTYWNFIQIGNEENIGYSTSDKIPVPKNSMDKINDVFRQGTTIWHNHNNIGNFSLDNSI